MKNLYSKYLKIMSPGWSKGFFHAPFFFGFEWWLQNCCKAILCLGLMHLAMVLIVLFGIAEGGAGFFAGHLAVIAVDALIALVIFSVFLRLYGRQVTDEQYTWCVALRPYVKLPEPSPTMTKVNLAVYVHAWQQMSPEEQERHYPYSEA